MANKALLILGPSGVGKSAAIEEIKANPELLVFILDDAIKEQNNENSISKYFDKIGNEEFCKKSVVAIEELIKRNINCKILIDVGAGSIDWEQSADHFLRYNVIALLCDKEVLYNRVKGRGKDERTFEQYIQSEFKPHKATIYENANHKIDTTQLAPDEVANEIIKILLEL